MKKQHKAFSLVELLVVIAVIAVLTALLLPATTALSRSYQLNNVTQLVQGQLNLARQNALSRGHGVEVRIYFLPDYNQPESSATPKIYRGMQTFIEGDPTLTTVPVTALTKPAMFLSPVVILDDNKKSTLLTLTATTPTTSLSSFALNYKYISFRFRPDGSTDLTTAATGLVLVLQNDALEPNGLPKNFRSVEIDPKNGVARVYQP